MSRHPVVLLCFVLVAACGTVPPPPSPPPATEGRSAALAASPSPTTVTTPTPSPSPQGTPGLSPGPSAVAVPTPPYPVFAYGPTQEPGTIIFGEPQDGGVEPYAGWPDGGLPIDRSFAFGAYWGTPANVSRIRITLYRVNDDTLELVWTDVMSIAKDATGFSDTLVPFKRTGLYRLEVTRGPDLLAWALTRMNPPCIENCSGG